MLKQQAILSLDVGTTSTRAILFDAQGKALFQADLACELSYPENGWVEQSPEELLEKSIEVIKSNIDYAQKNNIDILSMGITNQRETTIVWDKTTGKSVYPAIVWQDRRAAEYCQKLASAENSKIVREKTGLMLDPYFSASKIRWIIDHKEASEADLDNWLFGTVDSFIIWHLTNKSQHVTDATNASRTILFNIISNQWDDELLNIFNIPKHMLPEVKDSSDDFGSCDDQLIGMTIPIYGVAGDQQAAAIGQACLSPGMIKSTYGTGCFMLMNTGTKLIRSKSNMLSTIAYRVNGETSYALEGAIFNAGTSVQWLRDNLMLFSESKETETLARSLSDNAGVYMVPAFTGLGAPYWDSEARGAIYGITRDTQISHITRAALESVCYQTYDLLTAMEQDSELKITHLRVDGGMAENEWLLQLLSDIVDVVVQRPNTVQTTALGAAYLAGLQSGLFTSMEDITACWQLDCEKSPREEKRPRRATMLAGWKDAITRTLTTKVEKH